MRSNLEIVNNNHIQPVKLESSLDMDDKTVTNQINKDRPMTRQTINYSKLTQMLAGPTNL